MSLFFAVAALAGAYEPVPLSSQSAAAASEPPVWWVTALRDETARPIADDLPASAITFRFQCSVAQASKAISYISPKCVRADGLPISDPVVFAQRAADEAALDAVTAHDRLRRVAWLRAILLNSTSDKPIEAFRTFVVEVPIGAADLLQWKPAMGEILPSDLTYVVAPRFEYSRAALRNGAQGTIKLTCRLEQKLALECRTAEARSFAKLQMSDGGLDLDAQSYYFLLHDAHNAMQNARVAQVTKSGAPVEDRDISVPISFKLK